MNTYLRTSLQILAVIFILLGIIGLFLPILQGILFIIVGIYLLSISSLKFKTWFDRHLVRFPRIKKHFDHQYERLDRFWERLKKRKQQ